MPKPKEKPHYVKNADFSQAVVEYVKKTNECIERGEPKPIVPNYVAECFLKIAEGLSHKANFVRYTYREEMVMDAVENCLRAIENYNLETATRTGKPNAFAYFTQISWYAFLRRIDKEKRQQDIKIKYIVESGMSELVVEEISNNAAAQATHAFVEELRDRIDFVKESDRLFKLYAKEEQRKKRSRQTDSDLTDWL
jgi:hypothetical protein